VIEESTFNETATTESALYCVVAEFSMCVGADNLTTSLSVHFMSEHREDKA
jgi:hypothetical protein